MPATERPAGEWPERQAILRDTEQLRALVAAMQEGGKVDFRYIHEVPSRIVSAAYEVWMKAEMEKIAHRG
jgi:hypothetical protein